MVTLRIILEHTSHEYPSMLFVHEEPFAAEHQATFIAYTLQG